MCEPFHNRKNNVLALTLVSIDNGSVAGQNMIKVVLKN